MKAEIGQTVSINFIQGASQRTRNRIRENGPEFIVHTKPESVSFDPSGKLWTRFESVAQNTRDGGWHGWLPVEEIEVISE